MAVHECFKAIPDVLLAGASTTGAPTQHPGSGGGDRGQVCGGRARHGERWQAVSKSLQSAHMSTEQILMLVVAGLADKPVV